MWKRVPAFFMCAICAASGLKAQTLPTVKKPSLSAAIDTRQLEDSAQQLVAAMSANPNLIQALNINGLDTAGITQSGRAKDSARVKTVFTNLLAHIISRNAMWCNDASDGLHWCGLQTDTSIGHVAAKKFWDQTDAGGFTAVKMLNIQGLGDKEAQSVYTEIVSDIWNSWRVGLGGVFTNTDSAAAGGDSANSKSKAQKFLNGGGPAVVTLARPIAVLNFVGTRTVGLLKIQSAFTAPGKNSQTADSTKFSDIGIDLQSQVNGDLGKMGGIGTFHLGEILGGKSFYRSFGRHRAFTASHFSLGLLIENSMRVSWTRFIIGPSQLIDQTDLITVNFVR